ncbi:MAG: exopolysaccharide biosynthesis polyprenyl glycosylphosphotransferase [Deltaproteobacteria bacterium]
MQTRYIQRENLLLFIGDIVLALAGYYIALTIGAGLKAVEFSSWQRLLAGVFIPGTYIFMFYLADMYDGEIRLKSPNYLIRFLSAVAMAALVGAAIFLMLPSFGSIVLISFLSALMAGTLTYFWRFAFERLFRAIWKGKRIFILTGPDGCLNYAAMGEAMNEASRFNFIGAGFKEGPALEGMSSFPDAIIIDRMILKQGDDALSKMLEHKFRGTSILDAATFLEAWTGKIHLRYVDDIWFINAKIRGVRKGLYNRIVKPLSDLVLSAAGLILLSPIALLAAMLIKIDSEGPVLYRQSRVGGGGKAFELIKFRSMRIDAESNGAVWAELEDPRTTRVGRVIRKLRIDEIPQMWNVLKGEMSFVGPRPERPEFVERLNQAIPYYSLRHSVKPGITGWAQVNYSYGASVKDAREKLQYDLYYVKNQSFILEILILIKTIKVVIFGRGAR